MPENGPRFPNTESPKIDTDKDGKPKKKSLRFLPSEKSVTSNRSEAKAEPRPKSLEDIITEARRRKAVSESAGEDTKQEDKTKADSYAETDVAGDSTERQELSGLEEDDAKEKSTEQAEPSELEEDDSAENSAENSADDETNDIEEPIHWRELTPDERNGGEVIHIRNADPIEVEVPLHDVPKESPEVTERRNAYQTFTPQPEQQHQAADKFRAEQGPETPQPGQEASSGGGGNNNVPPPTPETSSSPEQPERPVYDPDVTVLSPDQELFAPVNQTEAVMPTQSGERPATKQEVEDAMYRSAQVNQQRGLLSGLFLGVYFANRGLRRKQKQETKLVSKHAKQLKKQQAELTAVSQTEQQHSNQTDRRFRAVDTRLNQLPSAEKTAQNIEHNPNQPPQLPAQISEQPLRAPEGHHFETSAWHTIEVDDKTGKPVEAPSFAYGQEYQREHAHEHMADDDQQGVGANDAGGSAGATTGNQAASDSMSSNDAGQPPAIPDASKQGADVSKMSKIKDAVGNGSNAAGPIWPWVAALVAVILCLAILIH